MSIPKQPTKSPMLKTIIPQEGNIVYAVCRSEKKAKSYIKGFGYGIKESRLV